MYLKENKIISYFSLFLLIIIIHFSSIINSRSESGETPIEIENPVFTTKGINEIPYTIKAASGIQKGDYLELVNIEGKIRNRDDVWIYLNADKGNYNQVSGIIFLFNNIEIYTDNSEKLISNEAMIDIQQDTITLISNVEFQNENNNIKADKTIITNNFQSFEYSGNVKTNIKRY